MADEAAGASSPSANTPTESAQSSPDTKQANTPAVDEQPWKKAKHKVKISGKESEINYDDLIRGYQLKEVSDAKLQEAAAMRRRLAEEWNAADPTGFFKSKNLDPEKWAEDLLLKKIKLQNMTPAQREQMEAREKEDRDREDFKRQKDEFENQQKQMLVDQVSQQLDTEFTDAFKAASVQADPILVDLMARRMEAHFDAKGEPMQAKQALEQTLTYLDQMVERKLQSLSADDVRKRLPKKLLDDLRKQDVELIRSQSPMRQQASNGASKPSTPVARTRRMSTEEVFRQMEEKLSS